ncbi:MULTISPECIES: four-carbon acid sugar kinase family protein [Pelosinus]|uniref:Type III effector Hrp-dependent outer protein n=1 Tax=Pelosinus fermentans B4 TaxID=1149862 RepID=I9LAH9_9FIRM|nr:MULTISPECIES: four-carbon acid sugar kinase family protein [Pelosinus]EIW17409.1 type III effector Hrp-dependent outer protein [Pelosinus fermentans B4]EIW23468.1 type III effector Hrp-dependent outer protein [Pelosinus fermentans A11]OAM96567.1 type III effector Hrp-dependent outer protein [Pelosinus fermentans DSM 17108]SDR41425.1 Uncharacterized conserved protein YgbK, DUF1537 family [Pelosinus fermentans]
MSIEAKSMIIIADDLTGANDTGVQFAVQSLHTEILLEGTSLSEELEAAIVVVDTNSRAIGAKEAYQKVQKIAKQAQQAGFKNYYKKLDSTLRGNIGIELQAILDLGFHDFALVMPAFPKNGRTTVGGHHLLHGVPLSETEVGKDPKTPVSESVLPSLLRQQTSMLVGHIGIFELSGGEDAIAAAIQRHLAQGCRVISCDAWQEEHFQLVAGAAFRISQNVLWAGSAGLAECLPQLFGWNEKYFLSAPSLVIVGSISSVTRGQIRQLLGKGHELVEVEIADYLPWQENGAMPHLQKALSLLKRGKNVILASGYQPEAVERAKAAGEKLGMSPLEVSQSAAQILGFMGAAILHQQEVTGVVLTGGDTAVSVCHALGVKGIRILEEVAPAIPLGKMVTQEGKTLWVVTKAGAFGNPDALVNATQKLTERKVEQ